MKNMKNEAEVIAHNQKVFEEQIDVLINYKRFHPEKDVYMSETSLADAIAWYTRGVQAAAAAAAAEDDEEE